MKTKVCTKCHKEKSIKKFRKDRTKKDGLYSSCKLCYKRDNPYNSIVSKIKNKNYYKQNRKKLLEYRKNRHKYYPWIITYYNINTRCNCKKHPNWKDYGGRDIKCLITKEEIKKLWFRDKAYLMKKPSIDRINNDGHYTYKNCRFIELSENIARKQRKPILQYTLNKNLINIFESIEDASKISGISRWQIQRDCENLKINKRKFIFRYA